MNLSKILPRTRFFSLLLACLILAGCGWFQTAPSYQDKAHDDMYKNGSVVSDKGGITLFGGDESKKANESGGIGVNGFLWRAALDTISFMPLLSADPFGGLILTDWYTPPQTSGERTKLNIFIRDRDLRADGVKVTVFRQTRDIKGNWIDASVAAETVTSLENAILTKARQIRMAQKQKE